MCRFVLALQHSDAVSHIRRVDRNGEREYFCGHLQMFPSVLAACYVSVNWPHSWTLSADIVEGLDPARPHQLS